jgi:ABC-2 type transport system permease protein
MELAAKAPATKTLEKTPAAPAWRANLATIAALMARAKNELVRVPGAAIPGVLAPTIFFLGLNGVFGALTQLQGFETGSYESFIVPVSMLQGAGFTGAAAGVNLARDYEQGWVDRLLVSPAPRWVLLAGNVLAASARSLIPATFVLGIAFAIGAEWPGLDGLVICYLMVAATAAAAACWGSMLALRFKSQSAAPLMQAGTMALILFTPAYAPLALLQPWLEKVANVNPLTNVLEAARQGFVGSVTWANTWPGFVALACLLALLGSLALREMRRTNV